MRISYNKLWKLLIDKNMTKMDLKDAAGISAASVAKLGKGANITTDVLLKICEALDCIVEDIMETVKRLMEDCYEVALFKYPSPWNRRYPANNYRLFYRTTVTG